MPLDFNIRRIKQLKSHLVGQVILPDNAVVLLFFKTNNRPPCSFRRRDRFVNRSHIVGQPVTHSTEIGNIQNLETGKIGRGRNQMKGKPVGHIARRHCFYFDPGTGSQFFKAAFQPEKTEIVRCAPLNFGRIVGCRYRFHRFTVEGHDNFNLTRR